MAPAEVPTICPDCGVPIDPVGDCGCDDDYARTRRAQRRLSSRDVLLEILEHLAAIRTALEWPPQAPPPPERDHLAPLIDEIGARVDRLKPCPCRGLDRYHQDAPCQLARGHVGAHYFERRANPLTTDQPLPLPPPAAGVIRFGPTR